LNMFVAAFLNTPDLEPAAPENPSLEPMPGPNTAGLRPSCALRL